MKIFANGRALKVDPGTTVEELCKKKIYQDSEYAMMAVVNNSVEQLNIVLHPNDNTNIFTLKDTEGQRVFKRSISFLFFKVVSELFPDIILEVSHTINRGEFCKFKKGSLSEEDCVKIAQCMDDIISKNRPIRKREVQSSGLSNIKNSSQRAKLFKLLEKDMSTVYELDGYYDYMGGILVPSTGYLKNYGIFRYEDKGIILLCPRKDNPDLVETTFYQPGLMQAFDQVERWSKIHNIHNLIDLNKKIVKNDYSEMIRICEALHEHCFSNIAEGIKAKNAKLVFVTGPSSSGKTTSANRIKIQLMVQGSKPLILSMDDYYCDISTIQPDENGEIDLESIDILNLEEFKKQAVKLLNGEKVNLRRFDFKTGKGYYDDKPTKLKAGSEIIIEGIHAFNPIVQRLFEEYATYRVCVNPLSYINIDDHNRISSTDCRKIRRMVRDIKHRGISAEKTLEMWPNIRKGEEKNIFPYLETADAVLNTTLAYELTVLKKYAEQALTSIDKTSVNYIEAKRLLNLLSYIVSLEDESDIPKISILQEFIS